VGVFVVFAMMADHYLGNLNWEKAIGIGLAGVRRRALHFRRFGAISGSGAGAVKNGLGEAQVAGQPVFSGAQHSI
jgi:hypothetical protein